MMKTDEERPHIEDEGRDAAKSPRTVRLLTAILLVATFACGTLTGAGVYRWAMPQRKPPPPPLFVPFPLEELDPTPAQREQIRQILDKRRPDLDAILDETYPKVRAITDEIDDEIRVVLTPDQRKRFDELKARRPPRLGPPHGPPPPHPGPQQSHHQPPPGPPPPPPPPGSSTF